MSYTVAKNTFFLTSASVLQKVISFVYFTFVARSIGVIGTGQYFFAIAFTTIFAVFADFGMGSSLTREAAKYPDKAESYFNTIFWTKFIFGILAYGMVVFFINIFGYKADLKILVYVSGITMFFDNLQSAFFSVFRAKQNLIYESIAIVIAQSVTLGIGITALFLNWPLYMLIVAYAVPSFLNNIYAWYFLRKAYGYKLSFSWDSQIRNSLLAIAVPFAIAGIIGRLYAYSDTILISKMLTESELGLWSLPYKIAFAFQFIPVALSASVYPTMSSNFVNEPKAISILFEKAWRYLFTIAFPLSIGLIAITRPVLKWYGRGFEGSAPVLTILLVGLVFGFLSFITGALLNATGHQKVQTSLVGTALVSNVIINIALIPRFGIVGAGIAAMFGNVILCLGGYYFSNKYISLRHSYILKIINQTFWPAIIMGLLANFVALKYNFVIAIPVAAVVYLILLFLTGGLDYRLIRIYYGKLVSGKSSV